MTRWGALRVPDGFHSDRASSSRRIAPSSSKGEKNEEANLTPLPPDSLGVNSGRPAEALEELPALWGR